MAYGFNDDKSKADLKAAVLELAYPVGSIYQSTNNVSPQTFLGGTWQGINGRFLVAQGSNGQSGNNALNLSAGAIGGETQHTLSVNEMPVHWHELDNGNNFVTVSQSAAIISSRTGTGEGLVVPNSQNNFGFGQAGATTSKGSNFSHNNLPPYLAVYMWKRTA